jgi:MFS family permease
VATARAVRTDIPQRLDRLPWSRFHLLLVVALGITWILDGLEVTIVGAIGPVLQSPRALHLSEGEVGAAASFYIVGAVAGALFSGWITDRYGRRLVFYVTLCTYLAGVLLSALSWSFLSFACFRALTGLGIGGEYAAVNSAIDELIPAKYRGRIDLIVNGSFWLGAAAGAAASVWMLRPGLVTHCREDEAGRTTGDIEKKVSATAAGSLPPPQGSLEVHPRKVFGLGLIFRSMWKENRARSLLAVSLMVAQAFLFNAVFFTYGLVLTKFYQVNQTRVGLYLLPLTLGNFAGPLLLGSLFDTVGRKKMIAATFLISALLLAATAVAFGAGMLSAFTQTAAWIAIFFFASAAASSAYLTASEIFPLETRALAIACFYALGTALGGSFAPALFAWLIQSGSHWRLSAGYALAAVLLGLAAVMEISFGVAAERKSLESIASPLSSRGG